MTPSVNSWQQLQAIEDHPGLTLDINIPPVFTDGTSTTRAVAEYTPSGKDIGDPVSATDVDSEYLSYSLEGARMRTRSVLLNPPGNSKPRQH